MPVIPWGAKPGSSGGGAVSSVSNSDGTLTISPTTGVVVGSLALGHANTWSGQQTFVAPILGTPASGTVTNLTGTASININGTVGATTPTTGSFTSSTCNVDIYNNNAVSVSSNAGTCSVSYRLNTFTNSSAATMAITIATSGATDGQLMMVRIYDFSGVAETIGWTNTENSGVAVPTTSNGSTTLPLTVGFQYNGGTSKWRCLSVA